MTTSDTSLADSALAQGVKAQPYPIAIVIPTYNEERNIARLLESIRSQTVTSDVIVVDQQSSDRTVETARHYGCRVVTSPRPSFYTPPGGSRNKGSELADAPILLHLDADMELPTRDFLARLIDLIDDSHRAAIIHELDVAEGFWGKCKAVERRCYWNTRMESARAVRSDLFKAVGGYDPQISSGEDFYVSDLYARFTAIASDRDLFLRHHTGRQSLRSMLKKKYRYGKTARVFLRKAATPRQGAARRIATASLSAYLRNARYLAKDPIHYLGMFPLRVLEFIAIRAGMMSPSPTHVGDV